MKPSRIAARLRFAFLVDGVLRYDHLQPHVVSSSGIVLNTLPCSRPRLRQDALLKHARTQAMRIAFRLGRQLSGTAGTRLSKGADTVGKGADTGEAPL